MTSDTRHINLLPAPRARAARRTYFVRVGIVSIWALALLLVIHVLLDIPTYFYLQTQESLRQETLSTLSQKIAHESPVLATSAIIALNQKAQYLATLADKPHASRAVRLLLSVPRRGISLTGITYTAPTKEHARATVLLTGFAQTRDSLRAYQLALQNAPFVETASLPVGVYAKDTNIGFTMNLTGSFTASSTTP